MKENLLLLKRFTRTLKNKIYKYMTSVSKNAYIDKLDNIVKKYNNTYHSTIKMKPVDLKSSTYIDSSKESNNKDPKFKIGDIVRMTKYKNIFAKGYVANWTEEVFMIKKVSMAWKCVINDLNRKEIVGTFYENEKSRKRVINYMLNGKHTIVRLIAG